MSVLLSGVGVIAIFVGLSLIYAEARGSVNLSTKFGDFIEALGQVVLVIGLALEAIGILI
jgi:hypothetical protein